MLYHYYVVVSHAVGHEKRIASVVPREQKKRAVKKDKRGTEREKRVRCPEESSKRDKEKYAAGNAAYFSGCKANILFTSYRP